MRNPLGLSLAVLVALTSGIANAEIKITQQGNWTQRFFAAAGYPNGTVASFSIGPGSQRILLVAIGSRSDAVQNVSDITYGGKLMHLAQGDSEVSAAQHTYLYYLLEDEIKPLESVNRALNVTISGGTAGANWVYSAVFAGVDQTAPFGDRKGWTSGATTSPNIGPFNPGLSMNPGDWPIEVILLHCLGIAGCTSPPTVGVWASGWDAPDSLRVNASVTSGAMPRFYLAHRTTPIQSMSDGSQHTASIPSTYSSMSGISLKPGPVTTLGPSTAPATSATVCPGAADRKLHGFSLVNSSGDTPVTGLTVSLTNGNVIQSIAIWSEDGAWKSSSMNVTSSSVQFVFDSLSPLPVTGDARNFKLVATYKTQSQLVIGSTATEARIVDLKTTNSVVVADAADGPLTLTYVKPPGSTWGTISSGDGQVELYWTKGDPSDSVVIARYDPSANASLPMDGLSYSVNDTIGIGEGTVVYVGDGTSFTDTGVLNGSSYRYRVFEYNGCLNYVLPGDAPWSDPCLPWVTTTLGKGIAAGSATVCPGAIDQKLHGFSLRNGQGGDPVTGLKVTLTGSEAIQSLSIWSEDGAWKSSSVEVTSGSVRFSENFPVTAEETNFKVVASYKAKDQAPPGLTETTARVAGITTSNKVVGNGNDSDDGPVILKNPGADGGICVASDADPAAADRENPSDPYSLIACGCVAIGAGVDPLATLGLVGLLTLWRRPRRRRSG